MNTIERLAPLADRVFDRLRHGDAFDVDQSSAVEADLRALRGHKYVR